MSPSNRFRALRILAPIAALLVVHACADMGEAPEEDPNTLPPSITLLAPDGGEVLVHGSTVQIEWTASDPDTPADQLRVTLDVVEEAGGAETRIASGWANVGRYEWVVPSGVAGSVRIRATVTDGERDASDASDAPFLILEPPPDGENLLAIGSASGRPGEQATVSLGLVNENRVARISTRIVLGTPAVANLVRAEGTTRVQELDLTMVPDSGAYLLTFESAGAGSIAPGTGGIAVLVFDLLLPDASTSVSVEAIVFSDPEGRALPVTTQGGTLAVGSEGVPPALDRLVPARTVVGDTVRIEGVGFGDTQGDALVWFTSGETEQTAPILAWSDASVRALVPAGATDGPLRVTRGSSASNTLAFSVASRLISYRDDLLAPGKPLQRYGCEGCHFCNPDGSGGSGGLCVNDPTLVQKPAHHGTAVLPRRSGESNLVRKLLSPAPFGSRMPEGAPPMPLTDIQLIKDWIDQGARDN